MDSATRRQVQKTAKGRCEYCRLPQSAAPYLTFHVEHIHARQHTEDDRLSNLCLACPHCNLHKGPNLTTLDDATGEIVRLFHPRNDDWEDHFQLVNARIEGLTPVGKATVRLLKINAHDQLEIRAGLIQRGEY